MKNLKVTINRSAGVKKYEVLPRQEKRYARMLLLH